MAVIINEMEVIVEPPKRGADETPKAAATAPAMPAPSELNDILDRERRYALRLAAH